MARPRKFAEETVVLTEIQVLLSEKRTALSTLRTGIVIISLPLAVLTVLITTSGYYDIFNILYLMVPVLAIIIGLIFFGTYLILFAYDAFKKYDKKLEKLKIKYKDIARYI